ncbi:hypothetical protein COL940_006213 [Colletotrichum noveboracense]|nr:hypothetical protein COL940_006213 [Colletotrichum noveboracense]KAJ0282763.1 hypothetical protein CBS470a_007618 [Colletotrichum nupharicola]
MAMTNLQLFQAHCLSFVVGIQLHVFVFRIGEWDISTTTLIRNFSLGIGLLTAALVQLASETFPTNAAAFRTACSLTAALIAGIYSSLFVYRAGFHRLNSFNGPWMARMSNLYITRRALKKLHLYSEVQDLHNTYGDIVRIGPTELSINNSKAIMPIHSNRSPCTKGPWYGVLHPMYSLQLVRDKQEHSVRRKAWDPLRDYEFRVANYTNQLLDQIEAHRGKPFNIADWFNFYSFDVMGDLAFGKTFGMLKEGIKHYFMTSLHTDMQAIGSFSHMLWLFPIFKNTPILNANNKRFWKFVTSQVDERIAKPDVYKRLRDEIDEYFAEHPEPEHSALSKLPYLQACIDEALRLHPPVPSGVQRMTPPEGLDIDGTFIPGNTIIQVPTYTMFRDERIFPHASEFIPERWITQPELAKDPAAFVPFGTGKYSCVGKQLGLMEVRYCASQIIHRYDVAFAPGQTAEAFIEGKKDGFTLSLPELEVIFNRREAGKQTA